MSEQKNTAVKVDFEFTNGESTVFDHCSVQGNTIYFNNLNKGVTQNDPV